jgi:hypothetical protein
MQNRREGLVLPMRAIICYLPWAILYQTHYGSPFGPSMNFLNERWQPAAHFLDILFSPGRGLFIYQPWLLFLVIRSRLHSWAAMLIAAIGLQLLLVSSWPMWWGGHCYGSRLLAEVVPLAGFLLLHPLERILKWRCGPYLIGCFVVLGLAIHLPCIDGSAMAWNVTPSNIDDSTSRLWHWSDPPFLYDWRH